MLTVNLGTGPAEEARNWLEYCNSPTGTKYADMRAAGGSTRPHDVKLWCLGNEMDGPWQLGHVPAEQYAIRARQAAKMMKDLDASVELVASGSSGPFMDTYVQWDRAVLENLGDLADYVSLHRYVANSNDDTPEYLAVSNSIDRQIEEIDAVCRCAQARRKGNKRAYLCFDEWNVWYKNHVTDGRWQSAPALLEETYNLEDALVVAGFLHSFIRHADSVKIANLAQIVNVIAPVLVRGRDVLIQSIFYPFEMFSRRRKGVALRTAVEGPTYDARTNGRVNTIDASAILDGARLHVFATNRDLCDPAEVSIRPAGRGIARLVDAEILTGPEPKSSNSFDDPAVVTSRTFEDVAVTGGAAVARLPRLSLAAMTFELD